MSNYTTEYLHHVLTTQRDGKTNTVTQQDRYTTKHTSIKLSNKRGMSMFKKNDYLTMQEESVRSLLDLRLWNYLTANFKQSGICISATKPITITTLSTEFNVTRQKISSFIRRSILAGFVRKQGTTITLNPFVLIPYGITDPALHELQTNWGNLPNQNKETINDSTTTTI